MGQRYKDNLDRLVEKIIRNPKTAKLQFANNIASVGGIGFFTHSSVTSADDRFLEVVLGTAETFEIKGDHSDKIARIFGLYGRELLTILSSDVEMFGDKELAGYGLNFTWRTLNAAASVSRVGTERAIVYFPKEKVRAFLKDSLSENSLLANAVIFAVQEDGPMNLVSFRAPQQQPDFRPPIQEQVLLPVPVKTDPGKKPIAASMPAQAQKETKSLEALVKEDSTTETEQAVVTAKEAAKKVEPPVDLRPADQAAPAARQIIDIAGSRVADEETIQLSGSTRQVAKDKSADKREKSRSAVTDDDPISSDEGSALQKEVVEKSEPAVEQSTGSPVPAPGSSAAQQVAEMIQRRVVAKEQTTDFPRAEKPQPVAVNVKKTGALAEVSSLSMGDDGGADRTLVAAERESPADIAMPAMASMTQTPESHGSPTQAGGLPNGIHLKEDVSNVTTLPLSVSAPPPLELKAPEPSIEAAAPAPTKPLMEQVAQNEPVVGEPTDGVSTAEKIPPSPDPIDVPIASPPLTPSMSHVVSTLANEKLALLRERPTNEASMDKPLVRPLPKSLEGYVIQVAFTDRSEAQRWADNFGQRGYAVSVTEAGASGALRLRIGNFRVRGDAERQLRSLKQDGLSGIILNLPQLYRPEVRSSLP